MAGIAAVSPNSLPVTTANGIAPPPLLPPSSTELAATAVNLSNDASVIATLGNTGSTSLALYDAAGLLNSHAQAGTQSGASLTVPPAGTNISNLVQQIQNQAITNVLAAASGQSVPALYAADGSSTGLAPNLAIVYAGLLKSDPNLAGTVISDSLKRGVVRSLNVFA